MNEVPKLGGDGTPAYDDIYVPGIGVRDALSDDAEKSDFRLRFGDRVSGGVALVSRWAIGIFGNVRRVRVRLAVRLKRTASEMRTAIARQGNFLSHLIHSGDQLFEQTRKRLFNLVLSAVSRLRGAIKNAVASTARLTENTIRALQKTQLRLRIAQIRSLWIDRANQYRLNLRPVPLAGNLRWGRPALFRAVGSAHRLAAANYQGLLRVSTCRKPDLQTLRRAAAPLTITLVMVVFVIQEIVTILKH